MADRPRFNGDPETTTVAEAKMWAREGATKRDGVRCPVCDGIVYIYPRQVNAGMAVFLLWLYHKDARGDGDADGYMLLNPTRDGAPNGDWSKLAWFGLTERRNSDEKKGTKDTGYWRMTPLGRRFVEGIATVPKYLFRYKEKTLRQDGPPWSIRDALHKGFDYDELMQGVDNMAETWKNRDA